MAGRHAILVLTLTLISAGCGGGAASSPTPTTPSSTSSSTVWRGIVIAEEHRCSPYTPEDYSYSQSVEDDIIARLDGIYSPYTAECFGSKTLTDIEHMVARSEAHDSGLCAADDGIRSSFGRDLDNLTLASPSVNRYQKGAKDANDWLPTNNRCWFAATIVKVRLKYGLTIDSLEAAALEEVLTNCTSLELVRPACASGT